MKITLGELRRFIFLTEAGEKKKTDPRYIEDEKEEETDADREEREMLDRIMQAIDMERKTVPATLSKKMKIGGKGEEEEEETGAHEKKGFSTSRRGFLSGLTAASAAALGMGALSALDTPMPAGTTQKKSLPSPLPLEVAVFPVEGGEYGDKILTQEPFKIGPTSWRDEDRGWIFHPDHWEAPEDFVWDLGIDPRAAVIFTGPEFVLLPKSPEAKEFARRVAAIRTLGKGGRPPGTSDAEDFETESQYRSPRPYDDSRFLRRAFGPGWTDAVDFVLDGP